MSKFLRPDSDSDSDDDYDDSDDDQSQSDDDDASGSGSDNEEGQKSRGFFDSSDSEEEAERVEIKDRRSKMISAFTAAVAQLREAASEKDWVLLDSRMKPFLETHAKLIPTYFLTSTKLYIKVLTEIEELVEAQWEDRDGLKKLNKDVQRGYNQLRQLVKKLMASADEAEVTQCRANPEDYEEQATTELEKPAPEPDDDDEDDDEKQSRAVTDAQDEDINADNAKAKLDEIIGNRGKRSTNIALDIAKLDKIVAVAETPELMVHALLVFVSLHFDMESKGLYMNVKQWNIAFEKYSKLLDLLQQNPKLVLEPSRVAVGDIDQHLDLYSTVVSNLERLDDEFTKSLQHIDPHTPAYIERLHDEKKLYSAIVRTQLFISNFQYNDLLHRVVLRRIQHIYYKQAKLHDILEQQTAQTLKIENISSIPLMDILCKMLYKSSSDMIRTRSLLYHVYHHALHGEYFKAHDMLLMSHLQDSIHHSSEVEIMINYNRAMAQIGLCAFRHGLIKESQLALNELYSSSRTRELLAQGIGMRSDRSPEQEKLERARQIPFHMHINLDLLEAVFFTCSMLLEVPVMPSVTFDARKRTAAKFRRALDAHEKQLFTAPPENIREHIMHATKCLFYADWKGSQKYIRAIKIWDLMPDKEKILEMLCKKIQQEALRTFLFAYSSRYDSLSLDHLASMFELPISAVNSILAKMIISDELHAFIDQVSNVVVLQHVEPSRLQYMSLAFSEKLAALAENNERLFESRTGSYSFVDKDNHSDKHKFKGGNRSNPNQKMQVSYTNRMRGGQSGQANKSRSVQLRSKQQQHQQQQQQQQRKPESQ